MSARILVTDGHSTAALAIVRSLGAAGHEVTVSGDEHACNPAFHSRYASHTLAAPAANREPAAYLDWLTRQVESSRYDILIPVNDTTVTVIQQRRAFFEQHTRIALPPAPVLERVLDKAETMRLAGGSDVRAPRTVTFESLADVDAGADAVPFPCVIKSRHSKYWSGVGPVKGGVLRYARNAEDLRKAFRTAGEPPAHLIVQEMVTGTGVGVFVLADAGRSLVTFVHRRVREANPTGGRASLAMSIAPEARLVAPALRMIRALNWSGVAMVEFKDPGGTEAPWLMEVNGRFWGSLPLSIAAGVDFPALLVEWMTGGTPRTPDTYRVGVRCRHLKGDLSYLAAALKGRPRGWDGPFPGRLGAMAAIAPWPGRWHSYNFRLTDPAPGLREAAHYVASELARIPRLLRPQPRTAP